MLRFVHLLVAGVLAIEQRTAVGVFLVAEAHDAGADLQLGLGVRDRADRREADRDVNLQDSDASLQNKKGAARKPRPP